MNKPFKLIHWAKTGLNESSWVAAAVLVAVVFLAAFVLLADPAARIGALWDQLRTPMNVVRLVVLAAAMWIWIYIMRIIRSTGAGEARSTERKIRKRLRLRRMRRARREAEARAADSSPHIIVSDEWSEHAPPESDRPV